MVRLPWRARDRNRPEGSRQASHARAGSDRSFQERLSLPRTPCRFFDAVSRSCRKGRGRRTESGSQQRALPSWLGACARCSCVEWQRATLPVPTVLRCAVPRRTAFSSGPQCETGRYLGVRTGRDGRSASHKGLRHVVRRAKRVGGDRNDRTNRSRRILKNGG